MPAAQLPRRRRTLAALHLLPDNISFGASCILYQSLFTKRVVLVYLVRYYYGNRNGYSNFEFPVLNLDPLDYDFVLLI